MSTINDMLDLLESIANVRKGIITDFDNTEDLINESETILQRLALEHGIEMPTLEDVRRKCER